MKKRKEHTTGTQHRVAKGILMGILLLLVGGLIAFFVFGIRVMKTSGAKGASAQTAIAKPVVKKLMAWERIGEQIVYDVRLGAVSVGEAVFRYERQETIENNPVNVMTFETRITRFNDKEVIYSDAHHYLPLKVERFIRTPLSNETITEFYDQKNFSLTIAKQRGQKVEQSEIKKTVPLQNAILLPYFVRRLDTLSVGWSMEAHLPTQEFSIRLVSIEKVKVPAGEFLAYHFKSEPKKFEIWVSADERRIPVKIRGLGLVGYVMLMKSYKEGAEK